MVKTIFERIYDELDSLVGTLLAFLHGDVDHLKIECPGFMDLHIDRLTGERIALAHNFLQNGDVMADPDMEILVNEKTRTAEALTFQQSTLGIYVTVYPEPGRVDIRAKKELNEFLLHWLSNLKKQGFFPPKFENGHRKPEPI